MNPLYKELVKQALGKVELKPILPMSVDGSKRIKPLIELVDLRDSTAGGDIVRIGTTTLGEYVLKERFVRISRLVVLHTWEGTTLNYDNFGDGDADPAHPDLIEGLQIYIDDVALLPIRITSTKDYMRYAYDTDRVIDSLGVTKKVYFTSRFSFNKFMGGLEGIDVTRYKIRIEADVDSVNSFGVNQYGDVFTWAFEGWGWDV